MFEERLEQLKETVDRCECILHPKQPGRSEKIDSRRALEIVHFLFNQAMRVEGMVYAIGNGGSSGIASHFCTDLLRTLEMSATTISDANILTCFANDFGYENVYRIPLMRNLKGKDVLVAISSSGKSKNILRAVEVAQEKKTPIITLSGFDRENPLRQLGDLNFWIDSFDYGLVETAHFFILHTIVDTLNTHITTRNLCQKKSESLTTSTL